MEKLSTFWHFVRGIHRSSKVYHIKGPINGALIFCCCCHDLSKPINRTTTTKQTSYRDLRRHVIFLFLFTSQMARFVGPTWAPDGPRWTPCCPHEPCYLGCFNIWMWFLFYLLHKWTMGRRTNASDRTPILSVSADSMNTYPARSESQSCQDSSQNPSADDDANRKGVALQRHITLVDCVGIIIGNVIGSGIFISPKGVLENMGSPGATIIAWAAMGLLALIQVRRDDVMIWKCFPHYSPLWLPGVSPHKRPAMQNFDW